jgi:peptidoglycan hydrolase-like protein with peptidoglycan-binding domain
MAPRPLLLAALASAAIGGTASAQTDQEWSRQVVRLAEQALARMNYSHGPVDGRMDGDTRFGLREFQRVQDLAVTGGLDMETLAALGIEADQYGPRARDAQPSTTDGRNFGPEVVRRAEQALARKQFVTGPIDGVMDPHTRFGLDSFQRAMDLAPTGELNGQTLAALGISVPTAQQSPGAGGASSGGGSSLYSPQTVRAVEQALMQGNYVVGPVNGRIEPDTQYGLRQFQRDHGLAPTGNLNAQTIERLGIAINQ